MKIKLLYYLFIYERLIGIEICGEGGSKIRRIYLCDREALYENECSSLILVPFLPSLGIFNLHPSRPKILPLRKADKKVIIRCHGVTFWKHTLNSYF